MRSLVVAALCLLNSLALAQVNVCTAQAIPAGQPIDFYSDITDAHPFACAPLKSATSTDPTLRQNEAGVLAYWYCKVGTGWRLQKNAVTWDFLTGKNMAANMRAALHSPDPLMAFQQAFMAQTHLPLRDPSLTPVWCPFVDEMWKNTPAADVALPPPGAVVWRALGTAIYTAANGKLVAPIAGARATAGAQCDTTAAPIVSGAVTYLPLVGAPATQVTSCKKASL